MEAENENQQQEEQQVEEQNARSQEESLQEGENSQSQAEEDMYANNHDLIGVNGIIRAQKNEIEKKKVSYSSCISELSFPMSVTPLLLLKAQWGTKVEITVTNNTANL